MSTGDQHFDYNAQALVDNCLETAGRHRASDIHIEPREGKLIIRFRIDGRLKTWKELPLDLHQAVISRLKVMGGMDIAQRRLPQDGRFSAEISSGTRDFRLSTVPQLIGEKAVIRVLHRDLSNLDFNHIGYNDWNLKLILEMLAIPHGLLLHCGPTGSGKTTALYTAINHLSEEWRNIQTIEDPVEGQLAMANQAQVNPEIGLTFASMLRSILRQDCDVILVGEIRDTETAQLAVQASLTGHLVLGTLHSNSAAAAITRLCDMGVSEFFVGTALVGVVSQRLVRQLCRFCRKPYKPAPEVVENLGLKAKHRLYQAVGCHECGELGYRGRIGIQEVLKVNQEIRDAIHAKVPARGLEVLGEEFGMITILRDGIAKAVAGRTTVEEVLQVVEGMAIPSLTIARPKKQAPTASALGTQRDESAPDPPKAGIRKRGSRL
jgi:type II secretory ATPase GspE/PulE/Tfp pilus assembly ATPase PilB-like protein